MCEHYSDVIMSAMASRNQWRLDCLLKHLFRQMSDRALKLRVTLAFVRGIHR